MTRNNKVFSFAMALVLCMAMLAPIFVAPQVAEALGTASASTVPTITTGDGQVLGTVVVSDTTTNMSGATIQVQLPTGVKYQNAPTNANIANYISIPGVVGAKTNTLSPASITIIDGACTDQLLTIQIDGSGSPAPVGDQIWAFTVKYNVDLNAGADSVCNVTASGDVVVSLIANNFSLPSGLTVVNARVSTGGTNNFALSTPTRAEGSNRVLGSLEIMEVTAGSLEQNSKFQVSLPDGVTWEGVQIVTTAPFTLVQQGAPFYNSSGLHTIEFTVTTYTASGTPGFILLKDPTVKIGTDVDNGDIVAKLSSVGANKAITEGDVVIGKKGGYEVAITATEAPVINNGQWNKKVATITLKESIAKSLVPGRTITFTLPDNARWVDRPTASLKSGTVAFMDNTGAWVNADHRAVVYTLGAGDYSASEIEFKNGTIALEADGPVGDITVTVGGTATAEGEVVVAVAQDPVTAVCDPINNVIIGMQNQPVSDILITEVGAGAINAKISQATATVVLTLPAGMVWAKTPTVAVTAGDLKINELNVTKNRGVLTIPVTTSSDEASTITISGVEVTSDRTVPEGPVEMEISGTSLDRTSYYLNQAGERDADQMNRPACIQTVATCVTPAPAETLTEYTSSFSLGSTIYYVNGMAKMMDVAVFAQDGRVFVPQRYLGLALGIAEENIVWDQATQTATFTTNDGKVATCTVGSNIITVDGVETTMDVTPLVVDSRIFLPARFLTEALGGTVGWDQATQTAFVNISV